MQTSMMSDFNSLFSPPICADFVSIIQSVLGLMQIQISLWNPISIIGAWCYKTNRSCSVRFGGLMSNSSTHSGGLTVAVEHCHFFCLYKKDLQKSQCVNVQIFSSSAPLKPACSRTIWNLSVFSVSLLSSRPFFSMQNMSQSLPH